MNLENSFNEFLSSFKKHDLNTKNEYLQNTFYKFDFIFFQDNIQFDDQISKFTNQAKIIIIDEYQEGNSSKYFFFCFDYQLIIVKQFPDSDLSFLSKFIANQYDSEIYYLKNNPQPAMNVKSVDTIFIFEINNFSEKFPLLMRKVITLIMKIFNYFGNMLLAV